MKAETCGKVIMKSWVSIDPSSGLLLLPPLYLKMFSSVASLRHPQSTDLDPGVEGNKFFQNLRLLHCAKISPKTASVLTTNFENLITQKNDEIIIDKWKTNLMSLAILFHFLCAQHVSDINISIFRSLRLCCWITTSFVLFCKDGWFSISVTLRCVVVCLVWCVLSPCSSW